MLTCAPADARVLGQRRGHLRLLGRRLRSFDCTRTELLPDDQHLGVAEAERRRCASRTSLDRGRTLAAADGELPLRAALEVDAEVEAADHERDDRDQDERPGQDRPAPRALDELEVRALVVQVGERVRASALDAARLRSVAASRRSPQPARRGPRRCRCPACRTSADRRAMSDDERVHEEVRQKRSRIVDRPRKNAKPRTDADGEHVEHHGADQRHEVGGDDRAERAV